MKLLSLIWSIGKLNSLLQGVFSKRYHLKISIISFKLIDIFDLLLAAGPRFFLLLTAVFIYNDLSLALVSKMFLGLETHCPITVM